MDVRHGGVTTDAEDSRSFPRCPPALSRIHCWALWVFAERAYVAAMSRSVGDYRPRDAEHAVLYRVIHENLDSFLETTRRQA